MLSPLFEEIMQISYMELPTLDEMIGLDKFNLTESQKHDCRSLANHRGFDAALEQAKKFSSNAVLADSIPLRECSDCGTKFKSHGRFPECNPMG